MQAEWWVITVLDSGGRWFLQTMQDSGRGGSFSHWVFDALDRMLIAVDVDPYFPRPWFYFSGCMRV